MKKRPKKPTKKVTQRKKSLPKQKDLSVLAYPQHLEENHIIEELRATVERLRVFDSLGKTLTSVLDLREIFKLVVAEFEKLVSCEAMGLVLLDQDSQEFYFQYPENLIDSDRKFKLGQGIIGQCLERGRSLLCDQPVEDRRYRPNIDGLLLEDPQSMMVIPIITKGSILGAILFATSQKQKQLDQDSLNSVESFADYLAISVENALNYQKVQDLTITDDLTQLYNSRYLPVVLEREIARARRYNEQLSFVFIDLDNFKQVNDQHGHIAGSRLLTEFGDFLFHQIRTTDIGIRYGGDEFVLILPKTNKEEAIRVVSRAIEDLREHIFLKNRQLDLKLTASFGISTFPDDSEDIDGLIAAADQAMYEVKKSSKNGLRAASETR